MEYAVHLAIIFSIYAILAMSLNLVVGYTGPLSVAHAAFYGIGAYSTAILTTRFGISFFASAVVGMAAALVVSVLIGMVLSRFSDDYYILASVGFTVIITSVFVNWEALTAGPLGIPGIPRPIVLGTALTANISYLALCLLLAAAVYWCCRVIVGSSFGRVLKAIREDQEAIGVFGYNTWNYKLVVYVVSAMLASIAGALFAAYVSFIDPSAFTINVSIYILAMIILGGLASLEGSLLGALFLTLLPEALRFLGLPTELAAQMRLAVYGLLLVLLMLYRPQGLVGEYKL